MGPCCGLPRPASPLPIFSDDTNDRPVPNFIPTQSPPGSGWGRPRGQPPGRSSLPPPPGAQWATVNILPGCVAKGVIHWPPQHSPGWSCFLYTDWDLSQANGDRCREPSGLSGDSGQPCKGPAPLPGAGHLLRALGSGSRIGCSVGDGEGLPLPGRGGARLPAAALRGRRPAHCPCRVPSPDRSPWGLSDMPL